MAKRCYLMNWPFCMTKSVAPRPIVVFCHKPPSMMRRSSLCVMLKFRAILKVRSENVESGRMKNTSFTKIVAIWSRATMEAIIFRLPTLLSWRIWNWVAPTKTIMVTQSLRMTSLQKSQNTDHSTNRRLRVLQFLGKC